MASPMAFDLDQAARGVALASAAEKPALIRQLRAHVEALGVYPASLASCYRALAAGQTPWRTTPALNLRGLTYDAARAAWRAAADGAASPIIFELAPVEAITGDQTLDEFAALVLAAAVREGYRGPVYLQGDHFQVPAAGPDDPDLAAWLRAAIAAGFRQLDLDAAGLAAPETTDPRACQRPNAVATARVIAFLRAAAAADADLLIGAEVGEIGSSNTTPEDLRAFMVEFAAVLLPGVTGIGKISVQTGTAHGGVVGADGRQGAMPLDLALVARLAEIARAGYGLPGVVQHGASTLSLAQLARLPDAGVCEVHLATAVQNIIFDHPAFPADLRQRMQAAIVDTDGDAEGGGGHHADVAPMTPAQAFYRGRWRLWGQFKRELWLLPEATRAAFRAALATWFGEVFRALRVRSDHVEL